MLWNNTFYSQQDSDLGCSVATDLVRWILEYHTEEAEECSVCGCTVLLKDKEIPRHFTDRRQQLMRLQHFSVVFSVHLDARIHKDEISNTQLWQCYWYNIILLFFEFTTVVCRGVARDLIWVGINLRHTLVTGTISNLSWVKETKQPHKKFRVDWFGGYIYRYIPIATALVVLQHN